MGVHKTKQPDVLLGKIVVLVLGLILLVKGSDFFVKAAAAIAQKHGMRNGYGLFEKPGVSGFFFEEQVMHKLLKF